jgi:hypothetical protein
MPQINAFNAHLVHLTLRVKDANAYNNTQPMILNKKNVSNVIQLPQFGMDLNVFPVLRGLPSTKILFDVFIVLPKWYTIKTFIRAKLPHDLIYGYLYYPCIYQSQCFIYNINMFKLKNIFDKIK